MFGQVSKYARLSLLFRFSLLLCLLFVSGCASLVRPNYSQVLSELRSGEYTLDPEHFYVHFKVEHLGLSTIVGRFNSVDANLDFNPEALEEIQLDGVIDITSIDLNNESLEKRLLGDDWFDAQQFPEARFQTRSVATVTDNEFLIEGDFTLRGVTKTLSLNAVFKGGADNLLTGKYTLGFSANGSILRSDFGIDSFLGLVADEVFIEIHAEFQRNG